MNKYFIPDIHVYFGLNILTVVLALIILHGAGSTCCSDPKTPLGGDLIQALQV